MADIINIKDHNQDISAINTKIGDENSGLIKEVNDIKNTELQNLNTAILGINETLGDKTGLPSGDANVIASINRIDRKTTTGNGLTSEQAQQLQTAYEHSQSDHVQASDIPSLNGYATETYADNAIDTALDNHTFKFLTQSEYDSLSDEEKSNNTVVYNIIDAVQDEYSLKIVGSKLQLLKNDIVISSVTIATSSEEIYGDIVISTTNLSINEGENGTFTVCLNQAPTNEQIISLRSAKGYCTLDKETLTFNSGNYSIKQEVIISATEDSTSYANKDDSIILSNSNVDNKTISVTIINTDIEKTLSSISAVFTQGDSIIYPSSDLNNLKDKLVVTATYSDNTTSTITDYTLSGTLSVGTSTITVLYGGKTTTFNVTVSELPEIKGYTIEGIPSSAYNKSEIYFTVKDSNGSKISNYSVSTTGQVKKINEYIYVGGNGNITVTLPDDTTQNFEIISSGSPTTIKDKNTQETLSINTLLNSDELELYPMYDRGDRIIYKDNKTYLRRYVKEITNTKIEIGDDLSEETVYRYGMNLTDERYINPILETSWIGAPSATGRENLFFHIVGTVPNMYLATPGNYQYDVDNSNKIYIMTYSDGGLYSVNRYRLSLENIYNSIGGRDSITIRYITSDYSDIEVIIS